LRIYEWCCDIWRLPDDEPVAEESISGGYWGLGFETTLDDPCVCEPVPELVENDEGP